MSKEPNPLDRAIYLLEDVSVSAEVLKRELSDESRHALWQGLTTIRRRFADANSEGELQRAAIDLLSLIEASDLWLSLLMPRNLPNLAQRVQWLEVHEQQLQAHPEEAMSVEQVSMTRDGIELLFAQAIDALLTHTHEEGENE